MNILGLLDELKQRENHNDLGRARKEQWKGGLPDKTDMGSKATMKRATVCAEKDAKGNTCPAVVVDTCVAVKAVLIYHNSEGVK